MKLTIKTLFSKTPTTNFDRLNQYYFPGVLIFSLMLGGILLYLSRSRSNENSISPETISCFEKKNRRKCGRRYLHGKRLKNKEIKEVAFTRCFCKNLHLSHVKIYNSDFRENNFNQSSFKDMSFIKTNFFKSFFYGAVLDNVVFENGDFRGAVFNFATLRNSYFKDVDLRDTLFIGTRFEKVYYDKNTRLPFSTAEAQRMGLFLKE